MGLRYFIVVNGRTGEHSEMDRTLKFLYGKIMMVEGCCLGIYFYRAMKALFLNYPENYERFSVFIKGLLAKEINVNEIINIREELKASFPGVELEMIMNIVVTLICYGKYLTIKMRCMSYETIITM